MLIAPFRGTPCGLGWVHRGRLRGARVPSAYYQSAFSVLTVGLQSNPWRIRRGNYLSIRSAPTKEKSRPLRGRLERNQKRPTYFLALAMSPEPPHLVQFLPSLAASTQHLWAQVLPSLAAAAQHLPGLLSAAPAKARPVAKADTTRRETSFFILVLGLRLRLRVKNGAGGGSRTRLSGLGSPHNSRYTTPARAGKGVGVERAGASVNPRCLWITGNPSGRRGRSAG